MRRGHIVPLSLLAALLVVPVAGADDPDTTPTAVGVTTDHATLQAYVVTDAKDATAAFELGPTTAYGTKVAAAPAVLPDKGATATATVAGLDPATTYHFRVVVTAKGERMPSADATFTTQPATGDEHPAPRNPATPTQPASDDGQAPVPVVVPTPPVLGRTIAVGPVAGTVRVRTPHGDIVTLAAGADVPSGSIVDATAGTVAVTSALPDGATQTGEFRGGRFLLTQARRGTIDVYLRGRVAGCRAGVASVARKRRVRRLWGHDHGGRYRTHGANSVATVRGTRWLVQDSCAGTLTRVTQGAVSVRDPRRKRTVTVRAGHSYLARRAR